MDKNGEELEANHLRTFKHIQMMLENMSLQVLPTEDGMYCAGRGLTLVLAYEIASEWKCRLLLKI